jgi:hypothetical protein
MSRTEAYYEGRIVRLMGAVRILASLLDQKHSELSPYLPKTLSEDEILQLGLDVDDMKPIAAADRRLAATLDR